MNSEAHKNQIIKCFHCGNETPMQQHGQYTWGSKDEENESDFGFFLQI